MVQDKFQTFIVDSCAGLVGSETLRQFPCLLDEDKNSLYVQLGDMDFALFTKSTFMNLCNFAESKGAGKILFTVDSQHRQIKQFKSMFEVIDARKLRSNSLKKLIEADDRQVAKKILETTTFYELEL